MKKSRWMKNFKIKTKQDKSMIDFGAFTKEPRKRKP